MWVLWWINNTCVDFLRVRLLLPTVSIPPIINHSA